MKNRTMSYTCPICCGSMLETDAMQAERLSETERLQGAVDFLVAALKRVQVRPAQESAFIAAVCLQDAAKVYGAGVQLNANVTGLAPGKDDK